MARQVLENGVILPAEYSDDWYDDMTSNLTKLDDVIGSDSEKLSSSDVGAAALSNNYNDLDNLPTIPTVNDATLTIQKNGVDVETFTANASSNVTANITVPTKTSDLTNDSNFVDTSNSAVSSGITSSKVTDYDTHIADTDIHVTTADKATWNTVTSKADDSDVVHKSGVETITGFKQFDNIRANNSIKGINLEGTTTDLNNCYSDFAPYGENKGGNIQYYYCNTDAGTANITNLPEAKAFFLTSITTRLISNSLYVKQILINSNSKTFTRYCNNSTWGSWVNETDKFVTTDTAQTISGNKTFSSINGVEPSSLSLPSGNVNDVIDISSYLVNLDGTDNTYVAPANGWITINMNNCSGIHATITGLWSDSRVRASAGAVKFLMPVLKNQTVTLTIHGGTINNARFIPCQGNV